MNQSNPLFYGTFKRSMEGQDRTRTAVSRPRFHAGCVEIGKAAGHISMHGHLHTHIFPGLGALFGRGKHVASFATFFLKCHGTTREAMYVDSIGHHV